MTDNVAPSHWGASTFAHRAEAGMRLSPKVAALNLPDPVILGLPRGGIPLAVPIAHALHAPLDFLVVRKLGLPTNPEYAFGAISEAGDPVIDSKTVAAADLRDDEVAHVISQERSELSRRLAVYREHVPPVDLAGKDAVVVDDGSATGFTAMAAIALTRTLGAATVTMAVGTAPPDVLDLLGRHADHAVAAMTPEPFISVSQWYRNFTQVNDDEVLAALKRSGREHARHQGI